MPSAEPVQGSGEANSEQTFDVVATYRRLLAEDDDLTMPIAAIEALIEGLASTPASTFAETLDLVSKLTKQLKEGIPNSISLSAGTDLFRNFLMSTLQGRNARGDFEEIRATIFADGKKYVERAKAARETIASFGQRFIRDGNVILTNGGSRVVGSLLRGAAESSNNRGSIRFKVIYVTSPNKTAEEDESAANIAALRERDIPVATIPATAVAYCMDQVTQCFVGAEGVVENGGIVSRLGTYQMGMLAKAAGKPFYVVSESHKFVRLFPLNQHDLGIEQNVVDFRTASGSVRDDDGYGWEDGDKEAAGADAATKAAKSLVLSLPNEAVDYTPPHIISGIITETGVMLPSAVSEELIKIWF